MSEAVANIIEKAAETTNNLLSKIFGPAADGMGINISQGVKLRVVENQIRGLKKLAEICEKENFPMRQVNLKVLFPYLEGIALEEEPELEKLWTNLMTNYLDSKKNLIKIVFPGILKQLSTREAEILQEISKRIRVNVVPTGEVRDGTDGFFNYGEICNLDRLGLVKEKIEVIQQWHGTEEEKPVGAQIYTLTSFGWEFIEACKR